MQRFFLHSCVWPWKSQILYLEIVIYGHISSGHHISSWHLENQVWKKWKTPFFFWNLLTFFIHQSLDQRIRDPTTLLQNLGGDRTKVLVDPSPVRGQSELTCEHNDYKNEEHGWCSQDWNAKIVVLGSPWRSHLPAQNPSQRIWLQNTRFSLPWIFVCFRTFWHLGAEARRNNRVCSRSCFNLEINNLGSSVAGREYPWQIGEQCALMHARLTVPCV